MVPLRRLYDRIFPAIPAIIADEVDVLRYQRLQAQVPLLYMTMVTVVAAAMLAADPQSPFILRVGIPVIVIAIAQVRLMWWLRNRRTNVAADVALRISRLATAISAPVVAICTCWSVGSWLYAPPDTRAYYILLMAMGALSTTFALSSIRFTALLNMSLGIIPTAIVLWAFGGPMDQIVAIVAVICACFLARVVLQQHEQMVSMLLMKHQLRIEADSDPLTSLANRRALHRVMVEADARPLALALIDLDGFKAVNDNFGHAFGDKLLVAVAERMRAAAGDALLARLGGDEFALLASGDADAMRRRVDHVLIELARPFDIDGRTLAIGASAGVAHCTDQGCDAMRLLDHADKQLYAAKAARPLAKSGGTKPMGNRVSPVATKITAR